MKLLYDEIRRRFPEVRTVFFDDCADLPYSLMGMLADWLKASPTISPEVIQRVQGFTSWCEDQARTETAADDILTIMWVGFYEPLFEAEHTRALLPKIISKETFERNAAYFKSWVGEENYEEAKKHFA
jgi:hypothetical protein